MANEVRTYFEATASPAPNFPELGETRRCDVCVVGGGLAGISTALHLAERGYEVVVLEAGRVGAGASGRNSGFVLPGYAAEIDELAMLLGVGEAARLWQLSVEAVALVRTLAERYAIACDLKTGALTAAASISDFKALATQVKLRREFGYSRAELLSRDELRGIVDSPGYFGGMLDSGALHLHPLDYVRGLARAAVARGATIFERSPVVRIVSGSRPKALAANGEVEARHLVLAVNAFAGSLAPWLARRIIPVTAVIGATAPLGPELAARMLHRDLAVYDTQPALDYYRMTSDHRLIFGSASRLFCPSVAHAPSWLARRVAHVFPQLGAPRMDFVWSGKVDLTRNRLPDIGRREAALWYAQGFNGHGVALATVTGRAIADAIAGKDRDFALLAGLPYRPWPGGPRLAGMGLPIARAGWQVAHGVRRRLYGQARFGKG